jgi:hypothetical protein
MSLIIGVIYEELNLHICLSFGIGIASGRKKNQNYATNYFIVLILQSELNKT